MYAWSDRRGRGGYGFEAAFVRSTGRKKLIHQAEVPIPGTLSLQAENVPRPACLHTMPKNTLFIFLLTNE